MKNDIKQSSIYIDREDAKSTEEEERNTFIRGVLQNIGVPLEDVWPNIQLSIDNKVKLRDLLLKLEVEIINDKDRGYKIYHQDSLLAEWFKPRFILREDKRARTLAKKLFYEMVIKTYSVFDQEPPEEENKDGES